MSNFIIEIRTITESETVPDINAVINYLQPLGLKVNDVRITTSPWS